VGTSRAPPSLESPVAYPGKVIPSSPDHIQYVRALRTATGYKDISGAYCIDPDLTGHPIEVRHPSKHSHRERRHKELHATFHSRHGKITLDLAASGTGNDETPAHVNVGTKSGDVMIRLLEVPNPRHINLEIGSRKGNIALLVPRTFCGAIQVNSHRGTVTFLPRFAQHMRVVKSTDHSTLILFGSSSSESRTADYCELASRRGAIVLGLAGEDRYDGPEVGFWTRLGHYLTSANMKGESG